MSKPGRMIGKAISVALGLFAMLAVGALVLSHRRGPLSSCAGLVESQRSPNGSWIAELFVDGCAETAVALSLRTVEGKPAQSKDFFLSAWLDAQSPDVLFKWLSDSHLLVAVPEGQGLEKWPAQFRALQKPDQFKGVQLSYVSYSNDPDTVRDANSKITIRKPVAFAYHFDPVGSFGALGQVGCDLYMSAADGQYFNKLSLRLSASKTLAHRALSGLTTFDVGEKSSGSILFYAHQEIAKPRAYVTAATFDSLPPLAEFISMNRTFRPVPTPNGGTAPVWHIMWAIGSQDLVAVLSKIKLGTFDIKVGFWLDNIEVLYSSAPPGDSGAVEEFERCMAEKAIFSDMP
jgi:hypothetical protein